METVTTSAGERHLLGTERRRPARARGFTLIELMVVIAIIGILVSIAVPTYRTIVERAKETVLRHNLASIRDVIDQYYADKGRYPSALEDMVSAGYFKVRLPVDPMTGAADWTEVPFSGAEEGQLEPLEGEDTGGIWDVRSSAPGNGLNGTPYAEW